MASCHRLSSLSILLDPSYDKEEEMIVDDKNKQVLIEAKDITYILQAYVRSYLFVSKNEDPETIVFPMLPSIPHPLDTTKRIPVYWAKMDEPIVAEIVEDGGNVPPVTAEQEATLDAKDDVIKEGKEAIGQSADTKPAPAPTVRAPKEAPGGDIGAGHPDGMGSRDLRLDRQISRHLKEEPEVDETKEKEAEIEKPQ